MGSICRQSITSNHQHLQGSLISTAPQSPLSSLAASEALLDDAADKLQRELEGYDQKLQALKSHTGSIPAIPSPPNAGAALKASIAAATAKTDRQAPPPVAAAAPPTASAEQPIVRSVITATGQGCKEVLAASAKAASMGTRRKNGSAASAAATWKTRAHKAPRTQSSCMLQLGAKTYRDVAIRITFADAITVPALLCFEHAPTPTAPFVLLGQVPLQPKSTKQLKHVFRLGVDTTVEKCLRITCLGHIAKNHSGVHSVSHLLVTGEVAPPSPPPVAPVDSFTSSGSTVKKVLVGSEEPVEEEIESASIPVEAVAFHNVSLDAGKLDTAAVTSHGGGNEKVVKKVNEKKKAAPPPPPLPVAVAMPPSAKKGAAAPPPPPPPPAPPATASGTRLAPGKVGPAPSRPTLKLFWDKVQPRESIIQKTVWGQLPESTSENNNLEIDFAQLEEEFAAKAPAAGIKNTSVPSVRPAGPRLVTLNRANNVGAMLARLKLTPEDAKRALLRLVGDDDEEIEQGVEKTSNNNSLSGRVLDLDELESILPCLPTEDERKILAKYEGSVEGLTPCERFMLSVLPVPALQARLQAIVFLHTFDSRAAAVGEAAGSVTSACTEVRDSSLLRSILKTALTIGNFLNAGNRAGSAAAFQVDTLLKLRDIKSTTSRSKTLLHFLAREVSRQHPDCSSLASQLPTCRVASRISLCDLRAELDALAEGIEAAHRAGSDGGADLMHLDELLSVATERLAGVNGSVVEADAAFMELRSFLNSKPSTMEEPAAFFTLLATFCTQLDVAHAENAAVDGGRPSSAPALGPSKPNTTTNVRHSLPSTSNTAAAQILQEESAATMATPPVQQRDRVLSTIRAYSRLTTEQRKTLLTDKGAKERLAALGITSRHSVAAPTGLADFLHNSNIMLGVVNEESEIEEKNRATAMRISAPAISLAAMLAHATADADVPAAQVEEEMSLPTTEVENSLVNTEVEGESPCTSLSDEEVDGGCTTNTAAAGEGGEDASTPAVLSSPVARMLASSRNLVDTVALRCSTLSIQQEKEPQKEDIAAPIGIVAAEAGVPPSSIDDDPVDKVVMDSSPVTLRPLIASTDLDVSPQATPHVKWARKSVVVGGGGDGDGNRGALDTPEGSVLPCSDSLQPVVPGRERIWRSSVAALEVTEEEEEECSHAGGGAEAASSFACLSLENPMASAPTSLHFGYQGAAGQRYDRALEDDAGSPEKPSRARTAAAAAAVPAVKESFEEENELCCSTQWVKHDDVGGVRGSKRVSFSLPNSPRGSSSGNAEDEDEGQQLQEKEEDQFVESPLQAVIPSPAVEQRQQQQNSQGSIRSSRQPRVSIPGLDLDLAKQLVKNASQVKKSRDRRTSYSQQHSYYSQQHPSMMVHQHQQQVDGGGGGSDGSMPIRESTPTPFVDSGALTPSPGGNRSEAPSIQEQAAEVLSKALADQLRRSLPGLPGVPSDSLPAFPLSLSPVNLDQIMAAIISNAGNTPTGPLARGVRQGDAHLFDDAAIEVLRAAAAERLAAAELAQPGQEHKALLEPIVPAPLGMGVRVSETVAHGISPSTLRHSLEAHLRQLQQTTSTTTTTATQSQSQCPRPLNVSMATAAQGPTPVPSCYREQQHEEEPHAPQRQQLQASMAYTDGSFGGCLDASYATSINPSRMTAGNYTSGNDARGGDDENHHHQISNSLRLSGSRQSGLKSGSVRDVHSSLAQERLARWNSGSQFHASGTDY